MELPERQAAETARAYEAFTVYCTLGAGRSCEQVAAKCQKSVSLIYRWCRVHRWVERAAVYDRGLAAQAAQAHAEAYRAQVEQHRARALAAGAGLYKVAGQLLVDLQHHLDGGQVEITPATLTVCARALIAALDLEAHALGVDRLLLELREEDHHAF